MTPDVMTVANGHAIPKIELTEVEDELRRLLLDVATYIKPSRPSELRFTGGWVRDKLLGVGSHDIDVGINDMTGYQFGLKMKEYLDQPDNAEKYGIKEMTNDDQKATSDARHVIRGLHKIEANPEKSKHLETVTTKIFGLDIDLVNLRKETYSEDSRNPQMEFGTPEEDALRRDATVNAMFYNLKTGEVEDLTHRGWNDMQQKLLRTPLDPHQTFKDDPLRMLRLIRFASRLGYRLDPAVEQSMQDESIRAALKAKISRERVGVEIEKMLKGPDPTMALYLIDRLGLYKIIFVDPDNDTGYDPDLSMWSRACVAAHQIIGSADFRLDILLKEPNDQAYIIWILSTLVPWADAPTPGPSKSGKKAPPAPGVEVARNGIKTPNKITDIVRDSLVHADDIIEVKVAFCRQSRNAEDVGKIGTPSGPNTLGMFIRKCGSTWRSQFAFAIMLETTRTQRSNKDILAEYGKLLTHIRDIGIENAASMKPIIDGNALAKALDTKPGVWMKPALDEIMAWQLAHLNDATPEGAIEAIRSKKGELPTHLVPHFLTLTVRPLFAQTKTQSEMGVTPQGRRLLSNPNQQRGAASIETSEEAEAKRPWKQEKEAHALQLLQWCISTLQIDPSRTSRFWPLLVPPLLALIDDVDVRFKAMGCKLLSGLFLGTDPDLLRRTGLGEVFQDAITPCLSYLPTLTPEDESVMMLDAAYPAVVRLALIRFPDTSETLGNGFHAARDRHLIHILHFHLLSSMSHVSPDNYPSLTICLLKQLGRLIEALGSSIIAQLMHIIPALVSVLSTPFASAAPTMIGQAARSIQVLLANAWPRVWRWRADIINGICKAWLNLDSRDDDMARCQQQQLYGAKNELKITVEMLMRAVEAIEVSTRDEGESLTESLGVDSTKQPVDIREELRRLREADARLAGLVDFAAE